LAAPGIAKRQNRSKNAQNSDKSLKIKALQKLVDSFIRLAQACQYQAFCYLNSSTLLIGSAHMKQRNQKLVTGLSAAMLCMCSSVVLAETVTVPATVTVNNAIDFTFTGTMDFGEVRATADTTAGECAGLVLQTNTLVLGAAAANATASCTAAGTAVIQGVGGTVARPVFTIAGVAPFTTLTLTVPNTDIPMLGAAVPPGTPRFFLRQFTAEKTSAPAGVLTLTSGVGPIVTDALGGAVFTVGANLITDNTAPTLAVYQDVAYAGSFTVTVAY
jgi:hypothetical protein